MSVVIRIKGADFSGKGLPKLTRTINGIPSDGLAALYLMEDGNIGDSMTQLLDSSGNNNHATIYSDWPAAIRQSFGLESANDDGAAFDTGIPASGEFTVIAALRRTMPIGTSASYPTWFSDTSNGSLTSVSAGSYHSERVVPNINVNGSEDTHGIYDHGSETLGSVRSSFSAAELPASEPAVLGYSSSAQLGELAFYNHVGGKKRFTGKSAELAAAYDGVIANQLVGMWHHGSADNAVTCELYAFAIYDRALTSEELSTAIAAVKTRVEARGVTF